MRIENKKPETKTPPGTTAVAFAVIKRGRTFTPTRIELVDGQITALTQCAPEGPYEALAYQYLSGKVMEFYQALMLKAAREQT